MKRSIGLILLLVWAFPGAVRAGWWQRFTIGSGGGRMTQVAVGGGRNDGFQRVYAPNMDHHLYEFSDSAGQWYRRDVGSAGDIMTYATVGRGRNDTINRVYGTSNDYNIWEYTYQQVGDFWVRELVGSGTLYMNAVRIGLGRNDTIQRVYGGCFDGYIYECTRQGNGWAQASFFGASRTDDIAIGPGRSDSVNRVYSAGYYGDLIESTYESGGWTSAIIWRGSALQAVTVGKGRLMDTLSDRREHVYIGAMNGGVYELSYEGGSWVTRIIGLGGGGMYSVDIGPGRGDFKNRVYAACDNGRIYEFTYSGGGWIQDTVGSTYQFAGGVVVGRLEVDGVYATSYDNFAYGFRYQPSGVASQESPSPTEQELRLSALPNPFLTRSTLSFFLDREEAVTLDIYNLEGRRIRRLLNQRLSPGRHQVVWDGSDPAGLPVSPGLYFVRLHASSMTETARLMKLE